MKSAGRRGDRTDRIGIIISLIDRNTMARTAKARGRQRASIRKRSLATPVLMSSKNGSCLCDNKFDAKSGRQENRPSESGIQQGHICPVEVPSNVCDSLPCVRDGLRELG